MTGGWQTIDSAPKDGNAVILGTDYRRGGHDQVRVGYWQHDRRARWVLKDENTQVREGWTDESRWHVFASIDSGSQEYNDEENGIFVRDFDPTHWMPLPPPPEAA